MKYKKITKYVINEGTKKYSRVRPVKKSSFEYRVALERLVAKLNSNINLKYSQFQTLQQFLKWFSKAPNYKRVDFGLDYRI